MEVCGPITVSELSDMLSIAAIGSRSGVAGARSGRICPARQISSRRDGPGMVRPPIAGANSSTHDRSVARRNSAGLTAGFLSLSFRMAARRCRNIASKALKVCNLILEQLDGCELPLAAWESAVLAARVDDYDPEWLDRLCFSGRIGWGRLSAPQNPNARTFAPLRTSPIALYQRENLQHWLRLTQANSSMELSVAARTLFDTLAAGGALFFSELVRRTGLLPSQVEEALSQLAALGLVTSDSFDWIARASRTFK